MRSLIATVLGVALTSLPSFAQKPLYEIEEHHGIEFAKPGGVALLLDLDLPKGIKKPPLVVFIHGGGWKGGTRKNAKMNWVAKHGYALARIEYRLSQEAVFPAQIHDCKGAIRWLRAHAGKFGYNAEKIVIGGTSAGGHLVALLGTTGGVKELEGDIGGNLDQSSNVQGIIDYYGPTDFVLRSKKHPGKTENPTGSVYKLLGGKASENLELAKLASPLYHVTKDDPPLLIFHGDKDKTVQLVQSEIFADAYEKMGLEVEFQVIEGAGHGWKGPKEAEKSAILDSLKRWFGK